MNEEEISKRIDEGLQILKQEPSFIFHPEEIKAIEHITKRYKFVSQNPLATNIFTTYDAHCLGTALNLISKLQKENEELREDKKALINGYKDTEDILNKRINCLFELLQQEGYLKFDNREQAIDYIDKLIKAGEENE